MKHITVFRNPAIYASHASACLTSDGDILVAYRQAPFEHIFAHVHPEATVALVRSHDGGESWSRPETILDPGAEMNVNDPSLTCLRDGTVMLTAFGFPCPHDSVGWGDRARRVRGNSYHYVPGEQRIAISRSLDGGRTWEEARWLDAASCGCTGAGVFASLLETPDGRLLMPISGSAPAGRGVARVLSSSDRGLTWNPGASITSWGEDDGDASFGLPSLIACHDGHLLAAGWQMSVSGMSSCESRDGGDSWTKPHPLAFRGTCPHLCLTPRGTVLMSYGHRDPPYGIRIAPSFDGGRTWDAARVCELRGDGAMRDLGYPWTITLADGRLMCVYYFNTHDDDKSYYDEPASRALCEEWKLDVDLYTYRTAGLRFIGASPFEEDELVEIGGRTADAERLDGPTLI